MKNKFDIILNLITNLETEFISLIKYIENNYEKQLSNSELNLSNNINLSRSESLQSLDSPRITDIQSNRQSEQKNDQLKDVKEACNQLSKQVDNNSVHFLRTKIENRLPLQQISQIESELIDENINTNINLTKDSNTFIKYNNAGKLIKSKIEQNISNFESQSQKKYQDFNQNEFDHNLINKLQFEINNYPEIAVIVNSNGEMILPNEKFYNYLRQSEYECKDLEFKNIIQQDDQEKFELYFNKFKKIRSIAKMDQTIDVRICDKLHNNQDQILMIDVFDIQISDQEFIKFKMIKKNDYYEQIINPRYPFQIIWTVIMFITIVYIIWDSTFELGFDFYDSHSDSQYSVLIITSLFGLDIIINFFLAYELEDGELEFEHPKIITNQLLGFFFFDLISTVPFELFLKYKFLSNINTQNIKILKIVKFIKLLRLLKIYSFDLKFLLVNEQFQEIAQFIKRNIGFFELMKVVSFLLILTHFQCCLQFQIKHNIIENSNETWMQTQFQQNYEFKSPLEIQIKIYAELLKSALGLGVLTPSNTLEVILDINWIILGLSIFGYGIGNISAQLNYANKQENEMNESINLFRDIVVDNNVTELERLVIDDITNQYQNYNINEFNRLSFMLSKNIKNHLETALQKNFIDMHILFKDLDIIAIRKLKQCKIKTSKYILRFKEQVHSVQFIFDGCISILNKNLVIENKYQKDEILGLILFRKWQLQKQQYDLYSAIMDQNDNSLNELQKQLRKKIEANLFLYSSNFNMVFDAKFNVESSFQAIRQSDSITYLEVPFEVLVELFRIDLKSFKKIFVHAMDGFKIADTQLLVKSNQYIEEFRNSNRLAFIIYNDGKIYDFNAIASEFYEKYLQKQLKDYNKEQNLFNQVQKFNFGNMIRIKQVDEMVELHEYYFYDNKTNSKKMKLEEKIQIDYVKNKDIENFNLQNLKKFFKDAYLLYFSLQSQE